MPWCVLGDNNHKQPILYGAGGCYRCQQDSKLFWVNKIKTKPITTVIYTPNFKYTVLIATDPAKTLTKER